MISDKKFIQDVYAVQKFSNYFNIYTRILTVIGVILFILRGAMWRLGGFFNDVLYPYLVVVLLIIALTEIIVIPYTLRILIKENKIGWIIGLIITSIFPFGFALIMFQTQLFRTHSLIVPVLLYSIFCYLLNSEIKEWLNEFYAHQNRLEQKRLKEERNKLGLFD